MRVKQSTDDGARVGDKHFKIALFLESNAVDNWEIKNNYRECRLAVPVWGAERE